MKPRYSPQSRRPGALLLSGCLLAGLWLLARPGQAWSEPVSSASSPGPASAASSASSASASGAAGDAAAKAPANGATGDDTRRAPASAKADRRPATAKPEARDEPREPRDAHAQAPKAASRPGPDINATSASSPQEIGAQLREALGTGSPAHKKLILRADGPVKAPAYRDPASLPNDEAYRLARARALGIVLPRERADHPAEGHDAKGHWTYDGETGPQNWARLSPEYSLCGSGKRQSPINITSDYALVGPAEPLQMHYRPSGGTVVDDGHTLLVETEGENTLTVRGTTYRLVQLHFHTPSEEEIDFKRTAMVAHLVHRSDDGQLAVLAVRLEVGDANPLIDKVWTYMPLDGGDRVRLPAEALNVLELIPADQRYYQYFGSLTTPPCTEGVLWLVFKQTLTVSRAQFKVFAQLFPMNARPVQPVNGRVVREGQ